MIMRKPLQTRENDRLGVKQTAPEAVNFEGQVHHFEQAKEDRHP